MLTSKTAKTLAGEMAAEVRAGLIRPGQKELPSRYLYDEVGSALFEVISVLPEYGLTRADTRLLKQFAGSIVDRLPSPTIVAELGSGSGKKTRWILEALARRQRTFYYPIEISPTALEQCKKELGHIDFVSLLGYERTYLDGLFTVATRRQAGECLLVLFLGSSIGNFDRDAGEDFLRKVRATLLPGDALLLSTDLVKSIRRTLLAYDDPAGVTASFNLNLLARLNRELDADFNLGEFCHEARWNEGERRVEMHLRSLTDQTVQVRGAGFCVRFKRGETIWTESSHKYEPREIPATAARLGFRCDGQWIDSDWPFAQNLLIAV